MNPQETDPQHTDSEAAGSSESPDADLTPTAANTPGLQLREPLPPVVDTADALVHSALSIAAGSGPIALDAERASGYRYSQRAYLLQIRRTGAGTHLIDPVAFDDHSVLAQSLRSGEWILHAATQDLPCLREIGLTPTTLFDTELAGRLLNLPRVGLAALVEHYLGLSLAKEFSAVDWSTRPLPEPWLLYAALDVEVLIELRDLIDKELVQTQKRDWAAQEFEALLGFTGPPVRQDPWRRTSGLHKARGRRSMGLVRELWLTRDEIAQQRDTTPGRILPDAAIVEAAIAAPRTRADLLGLRGMRGRGPRRFVDQWLAAIELAMGLDEQELPRTAPRQDGPKRLPKPISALPIVARW